MADKDKDDKETDTDNQKIPQLSIGDVLVLKDLISEQKFTKPPARFTEASLIKTLEDNGIGRPSTFATILTTLYKREYVEKNTKTLIPTQLGLTVTDYLEKFFPDIVDADFTAQMEENLDKVEENLTDWHKLIADFYEPFKNKIKGAKSEERFEAADELSDVACENCGNLMVVRRGRFGKYLYCKTCNINKSLKTTEQKVTDVPCEKCGALMVEKNGKYGKYLACPNYPKCKNIKPLLTIVAKCPKCGKDVAKRFSKTGRIFFGCTGYPECDFVSWDVPSGKTCPKCGSFTVIKEYKTKTVEKCSNKQCDYEINKEEQQ